MGLMKEARLTREQQGDPKGWKETGAWRKGIGILLMEELIKERK